VSSGIRSIFGYAPTPRLTEWDPALAIDPNLLPEWVVDQVEELTKAAPFGGERVHMGLAFDGLYLPKEVVVDLYEKCRKAGAKLITSHYSRGVVLGMCGSREPGLPAPL